MKVPPLAVWFIGVITNKGYFRPVDVCEHTNIPRISSWIWCTQQENVPTGCAKKNASLLSPYNSGNMIYFSTKIYAVLLQLSEYVVLKFQEKIFTDALFSVIGKKLSKSQKTASLNFPQKFVFACNIA
jgi:hypothetical protein